jgi:hypothetical protein
MSKPTKEDNYASLIAMENHLFDRLMYASHARSVSSHVCFPLLTVMFTNTYLSNSCDNAQPLQNSVTD